MMQSDLSWQDLTNMNQVLYKTFENHYCFILMCDILSSDYMIPAYRDEFHTVQPREISPYDYMWKLNFITARWDSFPPGI